MNKVRNIHRMWIERNSGVIVRDWTDEEYKFIDPHKHIFEKSWSYYCPICKFLPVLCRSKDEAEHSYYTHKHYTGHECLVEYRDFELVCCEFREEFLEHLGVWVHKQEIYF